MTQNYPVEILSTTKIASGIDIQAYVGETSTYTLTTDVPFEPFENLSANLPPGFRFDGLTLIAQPVEMGKYTITPNTTYVNGSFKLTVHRHHDHHLQHCEINLSFPMRRSEWACHALLVSIITLILSIAMTRGGCSINDNVVCLVKGSHDCTYSYTRGNTTIMSIGNHNCPEGKHDCNIDGVSIMLRKCGPVYDEYPVWGPLMVAAILGFALSMIYLSADPKCMLPCCHVDAEQEEGEALIEPQDIEGRSPESV